MTRRYATLVLAGVLAWLTATCGGGGGAGPTAPPPPPPPEPIAFTAVGTPGALTIHLTKADGTARELLRLEIRASEFGDLYGLGFDLVYPTDLLNYRGGSHVEGGFLAADGSRVEIFARQITDGIVIVGLSRLGDVGGVDGSGLLLTLDFTAVNNGSGSFGYTANNAFDGGRNPLGETVWQAGDIQINL